MPNEVTINIESSLAAMAFVIADQQQHLKEIREQKSAIEAQYANYLHSTAEELNSLHKKIDDLTQDCSDKVGVIGEKEDEIDHLHKVIDEDQMRYNALNERIAYNWLGDLKWHKWDGKEVRISKTVFSGHNRLPFVVALARVKDNQYFSVGPNGKKPETGDIIIDIKYLTDYVDDVKLPEWSATDTDPLYYAYLYPENVISNHMADILSGEIKEEKLEK